MRVRRTLAIVAGGLFAVTMVGAVVNEIADPTTLATALKIDSKAIGGSHNMPSWFHWGETGDKSHGKPCIVVWGGKHQTHPARICADGSAEVLSITTTSDVRSTVKCVNVRLLVQQTGRENIRVSGCGATPNFAPTANEMKQWLTVFTATHPKPSVSGDKKFCRDFTKFQNSPGYNLFTTLHGDVQHTDMGFRDDWNTFQHDLLRGAPGRRLARDNGMLTDDCTPNS